MPRRPQMAMGELHVPFGIVGCNFRRASSRWRSALVLERDERVRVGGELVQRGIVHGLAHLDTCNRNEWLFAAENPSWAGEILKAQMMRRWHSHRGPLPRPYVLTGDEAVRHLLRVASGLESFVVGERQIATQLNRALERSRREGLSCLHLNGLGSIAARVARDVHEHAGAEGVGVIRGIHDVAAGFVRKRVATPATALVVGMGEIGRRVVGSLQETPGFTVLQMNRTPRGTRTLTLADLPKTRADVVIVCTAAPQPIVTVAHHPPAPTLLVDLGIPSQIDPACATIDGVTRADLDDLLSEERVHPAAEERLRAAAAVVESGLREYHNFCLRRQFVAVLDATQRKHEEFITKVIPKFLDEVLSGADPKARGDVEYRLCGLLRQYTNSIFRSINDSVERRGRHKQDEASGGEHSAEAGVGAGRPRHLVPEE